ncbi:MAG: chemotaxis protein CheB [Desulfobulbaceae bacterium]|nr:chemotaxis protein CheB [Desulfobulbaceae bacterium]
MKTRTEKYEMIVIGVSAGGTEALGKILPELPENFPLPVTVVQHMHPSQDAFLSRYLNERCAVTVKEASDKEPVQPAHVYFAPANYHLLIEENRTFSLSVDEKVHFSRPSIDVLFESAVDAYGSCLVGIILTGANRDGASGLKLIKQSGGMAIIQDPATASSCYMPKSAVDAVDADYILPLDDIGPFLREKFSPVSRQATR